jgi:hypothetical protein
MLAPLIPLMQQHWTGSALEKKKSNRWNNGCWKGSRLVRRSAMTPELSLAKRNSRCSRPFESLGTGAKELTLNSRVCFSVRLKDSKLILMTASLSEPSF